MAYQYVTDCEGPVSLNDNAFELSEHYIPDGGKLFAKVSIFDDYLADIEKRPNYKAGDTLRLILPFLRAFGATTSGIMDFSRHNVLLVPGAKELIQHISRTMDVTIISTSYKPYIEALCQVIGFPVESTYSTEVDIDRYKMSNSEKEIISNLTDEIIGLSRIDLSSEASSIGDLSPKTKQAINRMDNIFFKELPELESHAMLVDVNPVGGKEKASALLDSLEKTGNNISEVVYVGDSITDVQALETTKEGGGLAISFNGNRYSIQAAQIAVISEDTGIMTGIADAFNKTGKEGVFELLRKNKIPIIEEACNSGAAIISKIGIDMLVQKSGEMRKKIRGVVGDLG